MAAGGDTLTLAQEVALELMRFRAQVQKGTWSSAYDLHAALVDSGVVGGQRSCSGTGRVLSELARKGRLERRWNDRRHEWKYRLAVREEGDEHANG